VLEQCTSVAVAFTTGEEHSGQGAFVCGRYLYERYGIDQALISDITWDTSDVRCGEGVAISLRDRMVPRQRFLDRVFAIAETSGLPFQREIESSGGSDGAYLQRSGFPIDWVFVGAPERHPHSDHEAVDTRDLEAMANMLVVLVEQLSGRGLALITG
jgi:putative aminopeptidase FrvX